MGRGDGARGGGGRIRGFDGEGAVIPGDADDLFVSAVRAVDGVFWGVEKGAGTIFHVSLDPFPLEDDDRFGGLGMTVSGNDGAGGELAEEESGAVGGIVGKVGKLNSGVGAGFPHGGIGKPNCWEHFESMKERIRSDNPWG